MSKQKSDLPMPHPELDATGLLGLVRLGNVDAVRRYFDESLHGRAITRPVWTHLRAAVEAYNVPMAKLLVTWGAQPTTADLETLVAERSDKAVKDILCMRLAGLNLHNTPEVASPAPQADAAVAQTIPSNSNTAPSTPSPSIAGRIPQEWKDVLSAIQQAAPEALIAGGALRDLCNNRDVKDVDIFLADRWMNKRLITKAFAAAGLTIHNQMVSEGYGKVAKKMTRGTKDAFNEVTKTMKRDSYGQAFEHKKVKEGAEAWTVIAGDDKTEYNIVFIKGEMGKDMKRAHAAGNGAATLLLEQFDIGLCQIAYDGKHVQTLKPFTEDLYNKTLTLVRPNHSSKAHIERVAKKYPDFKLCQNAQNLLNPPPPPPAKPKAKVVKQASNGYGYVSRPAKRTSSYSRGFSGY